MLTRDGLLVTFVNHGELAEPGAFTDRRCRLDHLRFAVPDRAARDARVERLDATGVEPGQVSRATIGDMVAFVIPRHRASVPYSILRGR